MTLRLPVLLAAALLLLPACREERARPELTPQVEALIARKADAKIGTILRGNLPSLFAGLVVFRSDAFLSQSAMLEARELSVLNAFGNAAIVLLRKADIPPLLQEESVKKIHYLCRREALARLHPAFEMEVLRRFGEGKEQEPVSFFLRFREPPTEADRQAVEAAGFRATARTGFVWTVEGPLSGLPRLLENDRIIFFEGASKARTM